MTHLPRSVVPQTVRSWWPSPWGCRSWRTGPSTSPDRWPSQGTHIPCCRSRAYTSPERRQNSPGKQTCAPFSTCCKPIWDLDSIDVSDGHDCSNKLKKKKKKLIPITHHAKDGSDYGPAPFHPWVWFVANHVLNAIIEIVDSCPTKKKKHCLTISEIFIRKNKHWRPT